MVSVPEGALGSLRVLTEANDPQFVTKLPYKMDYSLIMKHNLVIKAHPAVYS